MEISMQNFVGNHILLRYFWTGPVLLRGKPRCDGTCYQCFIKGEGPAAPTVMLQSTSIMERWAPLWSSIVEKWGSLWSSIVERWCSLWSSIVEVCLWFCGGERGGDCGSVVEREAGLVVLWWREAGLREGDNSPLLSSFLLITRASSDDVTTSINHIHTKSIHSKLQITFLI